MSSKRCHGERILAIELCENCKDIESCSRLTLRKLIAVTIVVQSGKEKAGISGIWLNEF